MRPRQSNVSAVSSQTVPYACDEGLSQGSGFRTVIVYRLGEILLPKQPLASEIFGVAVAAI